MNCFFERLTALLIAKALTFAISLSTTLVNSSKTIRGLSRHNALAMSTRIFSPWLRQSQLFSQSGGLAKPTLQSIRVISDVSSSSGKSSRTHLLLYSKPRIYASGKSCFAMLVLPEPLRPTITPICHSKSSNGNVPLNRFSNLTSLRVQLPTTL